MLYLLQILTHKSKRVTEKHITLLLVK